MLIPVLLFAFALPVGAQEVNDTYPDPTDEGFHVVPEACRGEKAATDCGYEELIMLFNNIIALLLYLAIFIGVLMFVYAGILYLTNAGDTTQLAQARKIFWNVIVGLAIAYAAYLIVQVIVITLGVCADFNPFTAIDTSC